MWSLIRYVLALRMPSRVTQRFFFRNLIKSSWNQIVFTIFWLNWIKMEVPLDLNQPENGKYSLISV